jgi:hypothetical protein
MEVETMKKIKTISILTVLFIMLFSFNIFAMEKGYVKDPERPTPQNETKYEDRTLNYRWVWLDDETCVRFKLYENSKKYDIERQYSMGVLSRWGGEADHVNKRMKTKIREAYSGKWTQAANGIWSFSFDDCTIPVGVAKIDGILYAFNTYGELKAEYEYYTGFKTEADGLVKADSAEFVQWIGTQYLPECTSHE